MDIWYQFAIGCGLIAVIGFVAAHLAGKREEKGPDIADKAA